MKQIIGTSLPRKESIDKATGIAQYTSDYSLPRMAYAAVLRSPYPHAVVKKIDYEKAKTVPGFLEILLPDDVPQVKYNQAVIEKSQILIEDQKILTNRPLCIGDNIAAVVAESMEDCEKILELIQVDYDILPAVFEAQDALKADVTPIHSEMKDNIVFKREVKRGDIHEGFEKSDYIFEHEFYLPAIQPLSMEPNGCICTYTLDDKLEVISTSQSPFKDRRILAKLLSMRESDIRIVKPIMGGGFGERQQIHNQPIAALLSKKIGRPVKMINTREEQMTGSTYRHSMNVKVRVGVNKDGTIMAYHMNVLINCGAYANVAGIVQNISLSYFMYDIANYLGEGTTVYTNLRPGGAVRGFGNPQGTFPREVMLNIIAKELKMDPIILRMKNAAMKGARIPGSEQIVSSSALKDCVEAALKIKDDIDQKEREIDKNGKFQTGWGVAFATHPSGSGTLADASGAIILVNSDGSVNLYTGSADIGQGSSTVLGQIVAEGLGIPLEDVNIVSADTDRVPYETGTFASSQAYRAGNAVLTAVKNIIEKIRISLAHMHDVSIDDIFFTERQFKIKKNNSVIGYSLREAINSLNEKLGYQIFTGNAEYKPKDSPLSFVVCLAKVRVNKNSNNVHIRHIIQAVDIGQPLNRDIVEGQIHGGISMAVGYTMSEQIQVDKLTNKVITADLLQYNAPLIFDMPEIHTHIVDCFEPSGPFGAKSVGELPVSPVAPAIANAIYSATGTIVSKLPITYMFMPQGSNRLDD